MLLNDVKKFEQQVKNIVSKWILLKESMFSPMIKTSEIVVKLLISVVSDH